MTTITANIAMLHLFEEAHKHTHLAGRFSPHKNFVESLEEWCIKNSQDIITWRVSMHRLFTIANTTKIPPKEAVRYVVQRDRAKLGLN